MPYCLLVFALSICSLSNSIEAAFEKPTELVEVIQSPPTNDSTDWHIGNEKYVTNGNTKIDSTVPPIAGNLAIVVFDTSNEQHRVATEITPLSISANEVVDGPYIFFDAQGRLTNISMIDGVVKKIKLPLVSGTQQISTTIPALPRVVITKVTASTPADYFPMPPKLLAVSDIEGNLDHLIQFLQFHNVIDSEYNWSWGENQLLFNGDSVDRGDHVTQLLWFVRKLQQQAIKVGGNVHFVLGNHEAMILADDIRYTHPKYKFVAERIGIPYHQLFGEQSILGNWMRAQNSIVQVGPYLFVHAGYGPELDALKLTKKEINSTIRASLGPPSWPERTELATSLAWHSKGPLWYRGYFEKHSEKYGPKPTDEELAAILSRHQASAIIVGHTVTGTVGFLDGDNRLIGIDVHWDSFGEGQGLLIKDGQLSRITMTESNLELANISTSK